MSEYGDFPDLYFSIFGLYTDIYYRDLPCKSPESVRKFLLEYFSLGVL